MQQRAGLQITSTDPSELLPELGLPTLHELPFFGQL